MLDRREIEPGRIEVRASTGPVTVLIPAGVGVPGVSDEDLAVGVVLALEVRGYQPSGELDLSFLLRADPALLDDAVSAVES